MIIVTIIVVVFYAAGVLFSAELLGLSAGQTVLTFAIGAVSATCVLAVNLARDRKI
jgi:hypothetical protein